MTTTVRSPAGRTSGGRGWAALRPGFAEDVTRSRRYWYAPSLGIRVRWHEDLGGVRHMAGSTFTYTATYDAALRDVRPS